MMWATSIKPEHIESFNLYKCNKLHGHFSHNFPASRSDIINIKMESLFTESHASSAAIENSLTYLIITLIHFRKIVP